MKLAENLKLVSACLLGVRCRYDSKSKREVKVSKLTRKEQLIPVCPEQLGGLPTPREPAWIVGGDGSDVLEGKARVINRSGADVTENFLKGAKEVLRVAELLHVDGAILKADSPSCGCGKILEFFSGKLKEGDGVTAALLKRSGIKVITEEDL